MVHVSFHVILSAVSSTAFMHSGVCTLRVPRSVRSGALRLRGGLASEVLATEEPVGGGKGSAQRQYSSAGRLIRGEQGSAQVVGALGERVNPQPLSQASYPPHRPPNPCPESRAPYTCLGAYSADPDQVKLAVKATFLPAGFPASVPKEYARYQVSAPSPGAGRGGGFHSGSLRSLV